MRTDVHPKSPGLAGRGGPRTGGGQQIRSSGSDSRRFGGVPPCPHKPLIIKYIKVRVPHRPPEDGDAPSCAGRVVQAAAGGPSLIGQAGRSL